MSLFAHHTEAFFQIEIFGRSFPDGMTEHVLAVVLGVAVVGLSCYGAYAAVRDLIRRKKRPVDSVPAITAPTSV